MNKEEKVQAIQEIKGMIESSEAMYFADFAGLKVEEVNELRKEFYKSKVKYKVVKNTLTAIALKETDKYQLHVESLVETLKGPTGVVFASEDPAAPAKIIKRFFDKIERPKLKIAVVENELYDSKKLNNLASLPTKKELIGSIVGSLNSPVTGIVGSVNAVMRDLFSVIEEAAKQKAA